MTLEDSGSAGWTIRSVLVATVISLVAMAVALQLYQWQLWPDIEWSFVAVPAIAGSLYLAFRHPGTGLLVALVFFPLVLTLLFYAGACLSLA